VKENDWWAREHT